MANLRKKIRKKVFKALREEGTPILQSALLTGFRTIGSELAKSPDLRTAAPDTLFRGIASAFRSGITAAGRELVSAGIDFLRPDRFDDVPPSSVAGPDEFPGFAADPGAAEDDAADR